MASHDAAYDSSSSASSDDAVLITSKHRKKLQQHAKAPVAPPATPKPDHICGVCERDGGDLVVCTGSCVSAFHVACLKEHVAARDAWKCPSCVAGTHVCFHCKQRGAVAPTDGEADAAPLRAVVKCRALSCGKFYHQDCIAKLPLARIAGSRFICPLHTCAACEQSGAKKEPVRCTRCPVAYHTSCLPRNGVVPLPGKRIICPKHDGALPPTLEIVETAKKTNTADDDAVEDGEVEEGEEGEIEEKPAVVKQAPALSRVASTTEDQDGAVSVAASSPRTEENDEDARSDTSATGGSSGKKHSKKDKKDKKKKKKKRKKEKKKERSKGDGDAPSDKEDGAKKSESKSKKSSKSTSSSSKVERRLSDAEADRGDDDEPDDKTAGTASEDDEEEEKAAVVEPAVVKKEKEPVVVSPPPPQRSADIAGAVSEETNDAKPPVHADEEAAAQQETSDHVKAEHEQGHEVQTETGRTESERRTVDHAKVASPLPKEAAVVETDVGTENENIQDVHRDDESEAVLSYASPERPVSPVKTEQTKHQDEHVGEEKRENLTVKIPEVSTGGDDGEGDEDSGSGSGSQSAKARNLSRTDELVKEKSGGSSRSKKSKKKRKGGKGDEVSKRGPGDEEDGAGGEPKDEAKWVQCDDCKKWRTVAKEIDLDAMPETWYCKMNTWNKAVASCDVPEEVVETKKSKSSKRAATVIGEVVTPVPKKAKLAKQVSVPEPQPAEEVDSGGAEKAAPAKKKADKDSKKRKLKLKLREKYGEVNWVQCENKQCGKWRVVPSSANALPSVWYCNLNTWAPELASCSAANPPDVEAYLSKSQSKKPSSTRPAKRLRGPDSEAVGAGAATSQSEVVIKPAGIRPSKGSAKGSTPTAHVAGASASASSTSTSGASASTQNAGADDGRGGKTALASVKSVVLEWAQCEKCLKWRKLPAHIKSSTLPDKWYCSMNHWDPSRASCALPQEEDQEPIDASPLPSSQNWYPMPGQVGGGTSSTGGASMRSKRGKLSYSELLYASTGQLRKTYTSDSSTLSFEYEGVVYNRDDQYKRSSMYVSPLTTNKISGEQIDPQSEALKVKDFSLQFVAPAMQELVEKVSQVILSKVNLRRDFAVTEIIDSVLCDSDVGSGDLSLSVITSAIAQLVTAGELEKVDRSSHSTRADVESVKSTPTSVLLSSLSSQTAYYRKVPKRPLKALKAWKLASL